MLTCAGCWPSGVEHPTQGAAACMCVNPTLVKQYARQVAPLGMVLWRQLAAAGSTTGSSNGGGHLSLTPAQIRRQLPSGHVCFAQ